MSLPNNELGSIALLADHVRDDAQLDARKRALQLSSGSEAAGNEQDDTPLGRLFDAGSLVTGSLRGVQYPGGGN